VSTQVVTSNNQLRGRLENLVGKELIALDDTYYIALENIEKEGATYPDKERVEQHAASCFIVQYNLQLLCEQLLASSNHPDAKQYLEEFTRRANRHRHQEKWCAVPNINYNLQVTNDFSGHELLMLDLILMQACQTANKDSTIEPLLFVISIRCSLLQQGTQLLLASSHKQASEVRQKLLERLAQCTAMYQVLLKQLNETDNDEESF
jgi:hypothetical protein